ncbi:hypothetical protein DFH09DRAFT_1332369 [Mycena vulgaris]|nr:hypothetical protein DFH09DRAFT_1332369 [Mycena vulgaris]
MLLFKPRFDTPDALAPARKPTTGGGLFKKQRRRREDEWAAIASKHANRGLEWPNDVEAVLDVVSDDVHEKLVM